jgi:hypothetical protein
MRNKVWMLIGAGAFVVSLAGCGSSSVKLGPTVPGATPTMAVKTQTPTAAPTGSSTDKPWPTASGFAANGEPYCVEPGNQMPAGYSVCDIYTTPAPFNGSYPPAPVLVPLSPRASPSPSPTATP